MSYNTSCNANKVTDHRLTETVLQFAQFKFKIWFFFMNGNGFKSMISMFSITGLRSSLVFKQSILEILILQWPGNSARTKYFFWRTKIYCSVHLNIRFHTKILHTKILSESSSDLFVSKIFIGEWSEVVPGSLHPNMLNMGKEFTQVTGQSFLWTCLKILILRAYVGWRVIHISFFKCLVFQKNRRIKLQKRI